MPLNVHSILMSAINTNTTTAYAGYENTPLGDTTSHQATFQSSTDYSLLQPTTEPNNETKVTGEDVSDSGWYTYESCRAA